MEDTSGVPSSLIMRVRNHMAASEAAKEAVALNRLFTELGLKDADDSVELGCDKKGRHQSLLQS
jgi:hypothetical protein